MVRGVEVLAVDVLAVDVLALTFVRWSLGAREWLAHAGETSVEWWM